MNTVGENTEYNCYRSKIDRLLASVAGIKTREGDAIAALVRANYRDLLRIEYLSFNDNIFGSMTYMYFTIPGILQSLSL